MLWGPPYFYILGRKKKEIKEDKRKTISYMEDQQDCQIILNQVVHLFIVLWICIRLEISYMEDQQDWEDVDMERWKQFHVRAHVQRSIFV